MSGLSTSLAGVVGSACWAPELLPVVVPDVVPHGGGGVQRRSPKLAGDIGQIAHGDIYISAGVSL
jgi:hypothetical protein